MLLLIKKWDDVSKNVKQFYFKPWIRKVRSNAEKAYSASFVVAKSEHIDQI